MVLTENLVKLLRHPETLSIEDKKNEVWVRVVLLLQLLMMDDAVSSLRKRRRTLVHRWLVGRYKNVVWHCSLYLLFKGSCASGPMLRNNYVV